MNHFFNYRTTTIMRYSLPIVALLAVVLVARAADPTSSKSNTSEAADRAAIRAVADAYVAAYNRGDAKAVAGYWSENGQWINPDGKPINGRAAIRKELEEMFALSKGLHLEIVDFSVRFVTPDVAVEEGKVRVTRPGEEPSDSSYIAIDHKQNGEWLLDTVRETDEPAAEADSPSDSPLKELGWLVGEWGNSDSKSGITASTNVSWTKNKAFLNYSFKVSVPGEEDLEGTQVIGWDPAEGTIRSWMFDCDGGFGEGTWTKKDNHWIIKFKQVLPDGGKASATNIYTIIDKDTITWQSIGREIDGQFMDNVGPIKVVRKTEKAK
jgi:uncharacterized protein (TIGR02246 family)